MHLTSSSLCRKKTMTNYLIDVVAHTNNRELEEVLNQILSFLSRSDPDPNNTRTAKRTWFENFHREGKKRGDNHLQKGRDAYHNY